MEKALLYVRVSSKEQENGYSLDAQEKLGLEYAKKNELDIEKIYRGSESAWKTDRKSFNQMIDFAKRRRIKHIIFDITDRMTRNTFDMVKIDRLVKEHDVSIHFSRLNKIFNRHAKPDEIFMLDIEVAMAKKYSNDISLKSRIGLQEKVEQGGYITKAPLGYKNNTINHTIEPDPDKAPYVKKAFELMSTGNYSINMIVDELYNMGLRSNRSNGKYVKSRVHIMLQNPLYSGWIRRNGKLYKGNHEPIISKELFDRVQNLFGKKPPVSKRQPFAFSNLLQCKICGCRIIPALYKKQKYLYYHCTMSKGKHENAPYLTEEKLDKMFEKTINDISLSKKKFDWLKEALKQSSDNSTECAENTLNRLENEKKALKDRLSRLYDDKLDKKISESFWKEKKAEYDFKLLETENRITETSNNSAYNFDEGITALELAKGLISRYKNSEMRKKGELLKIVSLNHTFDGENLSPIYKKPFDILAEGSKDIVWGE